MAKTRKQKLPPYKPPSWHAIKKKRMPNSRWPRTKSRLPPMPQPVVRSGQTGSSFFRLPANVRNRVYEEIYGITIAMQQGPIRQDDLLIKTMARLPQTCTKVFRETRALLWNRPHIFWRDQTMLKAARAPPHERESIKELCIELQFEYFKASVDRTVADVFQDGRIGQDPATVSSSLIWKATTNTGQISHNRSDVNWDLWANGHPAGTRYDVTWMVRDRNWILDTNEELDTWPEARRVRGRYVAAHTEVRDIFSQSYYRNIESLTFLLTDFDVWINRYEDIIKGYNNFNGQLLNHIRDTFFALAWIPDGIKPNVRIVGAGANRLQQELQNALLWVDGRPIGLGLPLVTALALQQNAIRLHNDMISFGAPASWAKSLSKKGFTFAEQVPVNLVTPP